MALHGASISSTSWVPLLPILAATHSVTMIDAIDEAGKSIAAKPTTNSAEMVAWLDETLHAVGIRRSAIVGLSRGTWIATHYTIAFPERVDRIALVCPVGVVPGFRVLWLIRALATMSVRPTQRRVQSFLDTTVMPANRRLLRQDPWQPIMQQFISGAIGFKLAPNNARPKLIGLDCDLRRLSAARIPVLAIIGRHESLHNGPKTASRLQKQLPKARIELVEHANHMVMVDQPEIVEKLLADFLQ